MGREIKTEVERLKDELRRLQDRREAAETEIATHLAAMPSFEGPLIDAQGFPRADVDIAAVTHHRQRVVMLKNDVRDLEGELARLLEQLHAAMRKNGPATAQQSASQEHSQPQSSSGGQPFNGASPPSEALAPQGRPFALVEEVSAGSPASTAGFITGDKIISFGGVTSADSSPIQAMSRSLQANVGQDLAVMLLRRGESFETRITPRSWSGQGLLGARVRPV